MERHRFASVFCDERKCIHPATQRKPQPHESTQGAALQETDTQDITAVFGRPTSFDAVGVTFVFRPETRVSSRFGTDGQAFFDAKDTFHHNVLYAVLYTSCFPILVSKLPSSFPAELTLVSPFVHRKVLTLINSLCTCQHHDLFFSLTAVVICAALSLRSLV